MLGDWKFWVLTVVGLGALLLSFTNHQLRNRIVAKQDSVLQRQQFITEAQQLSQFNSQFIRALANLAAQTGDANIQKLLADHGVTYTVNPPANTGDEQ